jgi:mono/diheme cytochrome c family protein
MATRFRLMRRSAALLGALLLVPTMALGTESAESAEYGKKLYGRYCSACHGPSGKGDGVVAQFMRPHPADLTQLAKQAGGKFPYYKVMQTIDGRETVRAHGDPDMPVWGQLFTDEEGDSPQRHAVARGKVVLITDYVETLQQK